MVLKKSVNSNDKKKKYMMSADFYITELYTIWISLPKDLIGSL